MKIASFNINGVNGRLQLLLRWLAAAAPDIVCLQELKSESFPARALRDAGYDSIWHGQKSWNGVAILAKGTQPIETRQGLPGGPDDTHSRYIEAAVNGVLIGCLYLPNGNPAPGPKFDYKLRCRMHGGPSPGAPKEIRIGGCTGGTRQRRWSGVALSLLCYARWGTCFNKNPIDSRRAGSLSPGPTHSRCAIS